MEVEVVHQLVVMEVGPAGRKTDGTYGTVEDAKKASKRNEFRNRGADKIKTQAGKFPTPTLVIASKPLQAGSRVTRDFFTDKVLGSKNYENVSKEEFLSYDADKQEMMYDKYISDRQTGKTDAYGNPISESTLGRREQKSAEQPKCIPNG